VEEARADTTVEFIMKEYYMNPENKELMVTDDLNEFVFKTYPSRGGVVLDPQYEIWFC
jgi:hypothetical protein